MNNTLDATSAKASQWQRQWHLFLMALQFYTRIPVTLVLPFKEADLNRASRYVTVVGWIVGLIAAAAYLVGNLLIGPWAGALLAVIASILATGAFHEDGLADACDGFGGGLTPERILDIMKDSRVGTYGSLALTLSVLSRVLLLAQLTPVMAILALILIHGMARSVSVSLLLSLPYVQADLRSKVKPIARGIPQQDAFLALVLAAIPAVLLPAPVVLVLVVVLVLLRWQAIRFLQSRLGGYTGDCLGAVEQLAEISILLVLAAMLGVPH